MPKVRIGPRFYDAEERTATGTENRYLVVRTGPGNRNRLWIHKSKSILDIHHSDYGACFALSPLEDQLANRYLTATIELYRGVALNSRAASNAKAGITRPKPTATLEEPDFTSEGSTTKYIPFSSNRQVAIDYAKSNFRSKRGDEDKLGWLLADEPFGVLVTIQVNTQQSICIFDMGEFQVLNTPTGRVQTLTPGNYTLGKIADADLSVPLDATAHDFSGLGALLSNPAWGAEGAALIGTKTPDGIDKMRLAYNQGHYWDIFRMAKRKSEKPDSNRSQKVIDLYVGLAQILDDAQNADRYEKLASFRSALGSSCVLCGSVWFD